MRYLVGLLLFVSGVPAALGCTCGILSPFLEMARNADLVVLGTVLTHVDHGIDFEIETVYRGVETRRVIRAWGDDGGSCRPYTNRYPDGARLVLALEQSRGRTRGETAATDFAIEGCGVMVLAVSNGTVYLQDREARVQLSRLAQEVALLDVLPEPRPTQQELFESLVRRGGTVSLADLQPERDRSCYVQLQQVVAGGSVSLIESIAAGMFDPPPRSDASLTRSYHELPALCRIVGHYAPTRDTVMPFELWTPRASWNGETLGGVVDEATAARGLAAAIDTSPLERGAGVFVLTRPAAAPIDVVDPVGGFRAIVAAWREPPAAPNDGFLGLRGGFSGALSRAWELMTIVRAGSGRIEGSITLDGRPVAGLDLRLTFEGASVGPWIRTDSNGVYGFDLPTGTYSIIGVEFDRRAADRLLRGAIDQPRQPTRMEGIVVAEGSPAAGPELAFIWPIDVAWPAGDVTPDQARQVQWNPYPGADHYWVWVGRKDRQTRIGGRPTTWSANDVRGTSVELPDNEVAIMPGDYIVRMTAYDSSGEEIATTLYGGQHEFRIVE